MPRTPEIIVKFNEVTRLYEISTSAGIKILKSNGLIVDFSNERLIPESQNPKEVVDPKAPMIGQLVPNQGIYFGYHDITEGYQSALSADGQVVKHHFFAAPQDLMNARLERIKVTFSEAAKEVGELRSHFGQDGEHFRDNRDFIEKLQAGEYRGGWRVSSEDDMFAMLGVQQVNNFSETFSEGELEGRGGYVTSSRGSGEISSFAVAVNEEGNHHVDSLLKEEPLFCRPIRSVATLG